MSTFLIRSHIFIALRCLCTNINRLQADASPVHVQFAAYSRDSCRLKKKGVEKQIRIFACAAPRATVPVACVGRRCRHLQNLGGEGLVLGMHRRWLRRIENTGVEFFVGCALGASFWY